MLWLILEAHGQVNLYGKGSLSKRGTADSSLRTFSVFEGNGRLAIKASSNVASSGLPKYLKTGVGGGLGL